MFWNREKVLFAKFDTTPDIRDRDIFPGDDEIIIPDKKGNLITLAEHKKLYPFTLHNDVECIIATNIREIKFTIKAGYFWNGADIPKLAWSIVGSQYNPEFKKASMVHDYMLEFKWDLYVPPLSDEISIAEFRRLTSLGFRQYLKNDDVGPIKSNVMSGLVQFFQATINRKEWKNKDEPPKY